MSLLEMLQNRELKSLSYCNSVTLPCVAARAASSWSMDQITAPRFSSLDMSLKANKPAPSIKNIAPSLQEPFDLIFIDADKQNYPTYLSLILSLSPIDSHKRLLKSGGVIIADNILRRGLIADSSDANPWTAKLKQGDRIWREGDMKALDEFNKELVRNERLDTFLMPMFDGLGLGRLVN
jgi:predicted O-methyltransferase YrrM